MLRWLVLGIGAVGVTVLVAVQPGLLVPVLVTVGVLGGLPLSLISILALVAVYSPNSVRRAAAAKVLDLLMTALRSLKPSKRTPRPAQDEGSPANW